MPVKDTKIPMNKKQKAHTKARKFAAQNNQYLLEVNILTVWTNEATNSLN